MTRRGRSIRLSYVAVGLFLVLGVVGPFIAPYDPTATDLTRALANPSAGNPLGTDHLGRDELSRLIVAARTSLVAVGSIGAITLLVGMVIGLIAGYFGGLVDEILMRIADLFLSIPSLIVALAMAGLLGGGLGNTILALSMVWWPPFARLARVQVLARRRGPHIEALELMGASPIRVVGKHLLPAAAAPAIVLLSTDAGNIMLAVATLSFLGLGVQPPTPEWGQMLVEARPYLQSEPLLVFLPGLAIMLAVVAFNSLGERLATRLEGAQVAAFQRRPALPTPPAGKEVEGGASS